MRRGRADRVPVMCQLALGHYFLNSGLDAVDVWHDGEAFAAALVRLQRRYGFDGVLVNLPGREPHWRTLVEHVEAVGRDRHVTWRSGLVTVCPPDDNPHVFRPDRRTRPVFRLEDLAHGPSYVEPHALLGPALLEPPFPPWHWDTLRRVRETASDASVHGEVFSPFSQLCEAVGLEEALVALRTDAARVAAVLAARCEATVELMAGLVAAGADAVLVSSAYAGAGFISHEPLPHVRPPVRGAGGRQVQVALPRHAGLHAHLRRDRRPARADGGDGHRRHRHARPAAARRRATSRTRRPASATACSSRATSTRSASSSSARPRPCAPRRSAASTRPPRAAATSCRRPARSRRTRRPRTWPYSARSSKPQE